MSVGRGGSTDRRCAFSGEIRTARASGSRRITTGTTVLQEGHLLETECEVLRLRAYEPGELIALLHESGFDAQRAPDDGTPEQERGERDLV